MSSDKGREAAKNASNALAHLYVWAAVIDMLEGGSTPGRQDNTASKKVNQVIAIARSECHRMLNIHDRHLAAASIKGDKA